MWNVPHGYAKHSMSPRHVRKKCQYRKLTPVSQSQSFCSRISAHMPRHHPSRRLSQGVAGRVATRCSPASSSSTHQKPSVLDRGRMGGSLLMSSSHRGNGSIDTGVRKNVSALNLEQRLRTNRMICAPRASYNVRYVVTYLLPWVSEAPQACTKAPLVFLCLLEPASRSVRGV